MPKKKTRNGFAVEIAAAIAGFHSVLSIRLDALAMAQNRTVLYHETLHERILTRTPDGVTHLRLKHLSANPDVALNIHDWAEEWCNEIEQHAALAHETIATYCAIKQDDTDDHQTAIKSLSAKYQEWYRSLADPIDAVFQSSYLQYLVGWQIAELCFTSPFPTRLAASDSQTEVGLHDQERPNWRLRCILERLTQPLLSKLLADLEETTTMPIQSEEAWKKLPPAAQQELDRYLSQVIRRWAAGQDFGIDTSLTFGDWHRAAVKVVERVDRVEGVETSEPDPDLEVIRLTEAHLGNRQMARPAYVEPLSAPQFERLIQNGSEFLLISSATFSGSFDNRQWIAALESRHDLGGAGVSTSDLERLLTERRARIHRGQETRAISTILVGVQRPSDFADHLKHFVQLFGDPDGQAPGETDSWNTLLFYLSGSYVEHLRALEGALDHMAFVALPLSFNATGGLGVGIAPGAKQRYDLVLHLVHCLVGGRETRMCRILNPLASGYAMRLEDDIARRSKATRVPPDQLDADFYGGAARLVGLVTALWPVY